MSSMDTMSDPKDQLLPSDVEKVLNQNVNLANLLPERETFSIQLGGDLTISEARSLEYLSDRYTTNPEASGFPLFGYLTKESENLIFIISRYSKTEKTNQPLVTVTRSRKTNETSIELANPLREMCDNQVTDFATIFEKVGDQLTKGMLQDSRDKNCPNKFLIPGTKTFPDGTRINIYKSLALKDIPDDKTFDLLTIHPPVKSSDEYIVFMKNLVEICRQYPGSFLYFSAPSGKNFGIGVNRVPEVCFRFPMNENGVRMKQEFATWIVNEL